MKVLVDTHDFRKGEEPEGRKLDRCFLDRLAHCTRVKAEE